MGRSRVCVLLLLAISAMLTFSAAQQPLQDSQQASQNSSANPAPPPASGSQSAQPQPQEQSRSELNSRIQRSVEDILSGDPQLSSADVNVSVDDHAITLTGSVDTYMQHQRVLALLDQYSRYRQIVDKLQTK